MKYPIYISTLLLLSSCMIGRKYSRPELNLPETIRGQAQSLYPDSLSIADLDWEVMFHDPALQKLIAAALENNKDILISAARIKELEAIKRISFASMMPELGASLYSQKEVLNYGGNNKKPDPEFGAKAVLSWEVDLWGNLRWANQASIASYMQSIEGRYGVLLTVVAEVASSYYQLAALTDELAIVKRTLEARQESVRLAKLRYEGGLTSEITYNQAVVELVRTETLIPALTKQIKLKENDLLMLLGEYAGKFDYEILNLRTEIPAELPVGLSTALLERRPDIRMAEYKLREANAKVGVAQTDMLPKIRLTGNVGFEHEELASFIKSPVWYLFGGLTQPLFAAGKNRAKVRAEKARHEQEVHSYQKTVLTAFKEVDNAMITFEKSQEIKNQSARLEQVARQYLEHAELQYINGVASYIDILDAQRGLFNAQVGLNKAILDEKLAVVYLYKALGGGY